MNRIGNILLSLTASLVNFKRTADLCAGYWGFRIGTIEEMSLTATDFSLEAGYSEQFARRI